MTERRTPQEPVALLLSGLLATPAAPTADEEAPARPAEGASATPAAPPAPRRPSHLDELDGAIEALLVVADRPLDLLTIASAVDRPVAVVRQAVERIRDDYDGLAGGRRRGFELRELATGWRLYARPALDGVVRHLLEIETAGRLSQAALETLAVIAYRQPVTRGQVAAIRAVSVDSVLKTLVARGLVAEVGRSEETGAVLYGTTDDLLVALGIRSLAELPPLAPLLAGAEEAHADVR
jgi:segregation and condensation protein B